MAGMRSVLVAVVGLFSSAVGCRQVAGIEPGIPREDTILQVVAGQEHTCALLKGGSVKCWGSNGRAALGLGDGDIHGDGPGEMGESLPSVNLGRDNLGKDKKATAIAAGAFHTCALFEDESIKCWGTNDKGQLGLGDINSRGYAQSEMGDNLLPVDLGSGRTATRIAAGGVHTCALLDDNTVKCWGLNDHGQLGLGDTNSRGDRKDTMGDSLLPVDLGSGRTATRVVAGGAHTCALLEDDTVKCWGSNDAGQLGLSNTVDRGDRMDTLVASLLPIDLGMDTKATAIAAGDGHTCAVLKDSSVKCWGHNDYGQLGLGDNASRGDGIDKMGDSLLPVDLGTDQTATDIAPGYQHTCVLLDGGSVKCWGLNEAGQLGLGDTDLHGDEPYEMGDSLPTVKLYSDTW